MGANGIVGDELELELEAVTLEFSVADEVMSALEFVLLVPLPNGASVSEADESSLPVEEMAVKVKVTGLVKSAIMS